MATEASQVLLLCTRVRPVHYICIKSCLRQNWVLVRIDPNGALRFSFTKGRDVFDTEADALGYLKKYHGPFEVLGTGKHVLGYVVIGATALLLVAEKARTSAMLPGNHAVKTVTVSRWHRIALQEHADATAAGGASSPAKDEQARGVEKITTFPIDGAHYFCETLDMTRPFPSSNPVSQPSWEFVWNRWLSTSWRSIGLEHVCPPLLQGMCEVRALHDFDGAPYQYALVSRRGRLHVGPRYKARGLNEMAEPGNEIECEQIIWRLAPNADMRKAAVQWSRYTWRRGSVPLWWSVKIKNNGMGEAEIKIQQSGTFKGSRRYVRRLQRRYLPDPHLDPDDAPAPASPRDLSLQVPLVFVSLLRKGNIEKDRSETKLASAFDAMAGALRKEHRLPLTYIALDWHEMDKQLGHEAIVEGFWGQVRDVLPKHGFALGTMMRVGPDHTDTSLLPVDDGHSHNGGDAAAAALPRCHTSAGRGWQVRWYRQQRGVMRYNCADSLDRTNVSSFFGALQVLVEQCRELDIAIALSPKGVNGVAAMMRKPQPINTQGGPSGGGGGSGGPGTPSHLGSGRVGGAEGKGGGGMTAIKEIGKELNKGLLTLMQDLKTPRSSAGSAATPRSTSDSVMSLPEPGTAGRKDAQATQQQQQQLAAAAAAAAAAGAARMIGGGSMTRSSMPVMGSHRHSHTGAGPAGGGSGTTPPGSPDLQAQLRALDAAGPLPPGWEAKIDSGSSRIFYVDHNTKTTSWERPPPLPGQQAASASSSASGANDGAGGMVAGEDRSTPPTPAGGGPPQLPRSVSSPRTTMAAPAAAAFIALAGPGAGGATLQESASLVRLPSADKPVGKQAGWSFSGAASFSEAAHRHTGSGETLASAGSAAPPSFARTSSTSCVMKWEPLSPWCMLRGDSGSCKRFGSRVNPDALSAVAELFLINGDLSAWLYTGSQAMHSERMLIFEPTESKLRKGSIGHYDGMIVALKRRFNNVWVDADKQMQMDMFLGLKHKEYFPNTYLAYREDPKVPLDHSESGDEDDPVGRIAWPKPESSKPPGEGAAGSAGSAAAFAGYHTRRYSSTDFIMQPSGSGYGPSSLGLKHVSAGGPPSGGSLLVAPTSRSANDILSESGGSVASALGGSASGGSGGMAKTDSHPNLLLESMTEPPPPRALAERASADALGGSAATTVGALGNYLANAFGSGGGGTTVQRCTSLLQPAVAAQQGVVGGPGVAAANPRTAPTSPSLCSQPSSTGTTVRDGVHPSASAEHLDMMARGSGSEAPTPDRQQAKHLDLHSVADALRSGLRKGWTGVDAAVQKLAPPLGRTAAP